MIFTAFIFITILLFHYHGNREHDESYVDVVHDHYGNTDYHDNHHNHLNDDKVTEENDDEDNDGNRDDEMSRSRGILYPLEVKDKDIWQRISDVSNYAISSRLSCTCDRERVYRPYSEDEYSVVSFPYQYMTCLRNSTNRIDCIYWGEPLEFWMRKQIHISFSKHGQTAVSGNSTLHQ